jgi:peptide-methionine (S)-S-oxide reductase
MKISVSRTVRLAVTCLALSAGVAQVFCFTSLPGLAAGAGETAATAKAPEQHLQKAIFAAGCFWGVEDDFRHEKGVVDAISGFTGGNKKNPTYKEVCTGATHHAEAVEVIYDPAKVTYNQLLATFWKMHDPTTVNSQGPDFGEQYRSAIFYMNEQQKKEALASRDKLAASGTYKSPIATQIVPAGEFYKAEEYHQHYFEKNPLAAACHRK